MFQVLMGMNQMGLIDAAGIRDMLGIEELDKDTLSKGTQGGGDPTQNKLNNFRQPVQINLWQDALGRPHVTAADWVNKDQWDKIDAQNRMNEIDRENKKHEWEVAEKKAEWSNSNIPEDKKNNKEKNE